MRRNPLQFVVGLAILTSLCTSVSAMELARPDSRYELRQLPDVDGPNLGPGLGISDAGFALAPGGVLCSPDGTAQFLADGSLALSSGAVSPKGLVAGTITDRSGSTLGQPVGIWHDGQITAFSILDARPDVQEVALGVSDSGIVVGFSEYHPPMPGFHSTAVRWIHGVPQDLSVYVTPTSNSFATAINASGQILLYSMLAREPAVGGAGDQSFLLDGTDLTAITSSDPNVVGVHAQAINDAGQVVGTLYMADQTSRLFLWSKGQMHVAPALFPDISARDFSSLAINNAGLIVGTFAPSDQSYNVPFLWDGVGSPVNLNDLIDPASGWLLQSAFGVNNQGQIVGGGMTLGGFGLPGGYMLTPSSQAVPEATTLSLLLVGVGWLKTRRRGQGR